MNNPDWQKLFGPIDVGISANIEPQPAQRQQISPGALEMAGSFGTSLAKFAAGGFRGVSKEIHEQRLAICNACEHFSRGNCLLCGCYIAPKTAMPHEACPAGKWQKSS